MKKLALLLAFTGMLAGTAVAHEGDDKKKKEEKKEKSCCKKEASSCTDKAEAKTSCTDAPKAEGKSCCKKSGTASAEAAAPAPAEKK
jgi:hypothetical protein